MGDLVARKLPVLDIAERGRLMASLLNLFGSDPSVARELERLASTADLVVGDPPNFSARTRRAKAYRLERDALLSTYGLDRLPRVERDTDPFGFPFVQPGGADFVDRWCTRHRNPGRRLPASQLGEAVGYAGEIPVVEVDLKATWQLSGDRAELREAFVRRVNTDLKKQIDAQVKGYRSAGRTFHGPPARRRDVHLRWLFERIRFTGKRGEYAQIAKEAAGRGELPAHDSDPETAEYNVTRAVTALGDQLGIKVRRREH